MSDNDTNLKPGEICPQSGTYAIVDSQGKKIGDCLVVEGDPFPPTPDKGETYRLVTPNPVVKTPAGARIEYSRTEKRWAIGLSIYLIVAFIGGLWFIWHIWVGLSSPDKTIPQIFWLTLLGMAGGWLGGVISAVRSLQYHYTSPVESVGDVEKQEKTRFHVAWWTRWFWAPWIGTGLALIVFALVRSGVLVFAGPPPTEGATVTLTEKFATLGLGGLVGLSSKDVVEKLILVLKRWLRVEEPEIKALTITSEPVEREVSYGGDVVTFNVTPRIPVIWALNPSDEVTVGTITNGVFRSAEKAPPDAPGKRNVIVTATSKTDPDRSVSTTLVLKK